MNIKTSLSELSSVSEIVDQYRGNPAFHMRRCSQEDLLKAAGVRSRAQMRSGRGYAHYIDKAGKSRLCAHLDTLVGVRPKVIQVIQHDKFQASSLQTLDYQVEGLTNSVQVLHDLVEQQMRLIKRLLKSLGESEA